MSELIANNMILRHIIGMNASTHTHTYTLHRGKHIRRPTSNEIYKDVDAWTTSKAFLWIWIRMESKQTTTPIYTCNRFPKKDLFKAKFYRWKFPITTVVSKIVWMISWVKWIEDCPINSTAEQMAFTITRIKYTELISSTYLPNSFLVCVCVGAYVGEGARNLEGMT